MATGNDPTLELRAQLMCLQQAHVNLNDELNEEHDRANHWKQRAEAAESNAAHWEKMYDQQAAKIRQLHKRIMEMERGEPCSTCSGKGYVYTAGRPDPRKTVCYCMLIPDKRNVVVEADNAKLRAVVESVEKDLPAFRSAVEIMGKHFCERKCDTPDVSSCTVCNGRFVVKRAEAILVALNALKGGE